MREPVPRKVTENQIKLDQGDRSTTLFRELMRYLDHRIEVGKEALTGDMDEAKTTDLRGALKELRRLKKALDPKILPTSKAQLTADGLIQKAIDDIN